MPAIHNLDVPPTPPIPSSDSFESSFLLSHPAWACGALLVFAALGYRARNRDRSRGVSGMDAPVEEKARMRARSVAHLGSSRSDSDLQYESVSPSQHSSSSWSPQSTRSAWEGLELGGTATATHSFFPPPLPEPTLSRLESIRSEQRGSVARGPIAEMQPPRRRSYTKMVDGTVVDGTGVNVDVVMGMGYGPYQPDGEMAMGIHISEEIIVAAEGWRRHTRVYGGGVCLACEESEKKLGMEDGRSEGMDEGLTDTMS